MTELIQKLRAAYRRNNDSEFDAAVASLLSAQCGELDKASEAYEELQSRYKALEAVSDSQYKESRDLRKELAEQRQEQLDSDNRWKERLKAERLRSEQAVAMERKNWEAYAQTLRDKIDSLGFVEKKTIDEALASYREGEAERVEAAVAKAYQNCVDELLHQKEKCVAIGFSQGVSLCRGMINAVRIISKSSPTPPERGGERPAQSVVPLFVATLKDGRTSYIACGWYANLGTIYEGRQ